MVGRRRLLGRCRPLQCLISGGTRLHHEVGQPEPLDEMAGGLI